MRRVTGELGVKARALYYHVSDKQPLLAGIADVILAPVVIPDATGAGEWLRDWFHDPRGMLLAYHGDAELVASTIVLRMGIMDATTATRGVLAKRAHPEPEATVTAFLHFILNHIMAG